MREITLGEKTVTIAASPITLYIYSREFGPKSDLIGDLMSFGGIASGDMSGVRILLLYQMLWAMCKTAKLGAEFPGFPEWLIANPELDISDSALWVVVLEEAQRGLFRGGAPFADGVRTG